MGYSGFERLDKAAALSVLGLGFRVLRQFVGFRNSPPPPPGSSPRSLAVHRALRIRLPSSAWRLKGTYGRGLGFRVWILTGYNPIQGSYNPASKYLRASK